MNMFSFAPIPGHENFQNFRRAHPVFRDRTYETYRRMYPECAHVFRKDGFLDDSLCKEPIFTWHDVVNDPDDDSLPLSMTEDYSLHMIPFTCCHPCSSWWDPSPKPVTLLNGAHYNVCCSDWEMELHDANHALHSCNISPGEMPALLHGYERRTGFPRLHDYQAGVDELSPIKDFFNAHSYLLPLLLSFLPEQTRCLMCSTYDIRGASISWSGSKESIRLYEQSMSRGCANDTHVKWRLPLSLTLTRNRVMFDLHNFLLRDYVLKDIALSLWSELRMKFETALYTLSPTSDLHVPWGSQHSFTGSYATTEYDPRCSNHVKILADHTSAHVDYIASWAFMGAYMNPDKGHAVPTLVYHNLSRTWFEERLHMCQDTATLKVVQARLVQIVIGMWVHPFEIVHPRPHHAKLYPAPEYEFAHNLGCGCPCESDDLFRLHSLAVVGAHVIDWRELCERTKPFFMWDGSIFGCDPFRDVEPWYTHTHTPLDS